MSTLFIATFSYLSITAAIDEALNTSNTGSAIIAIGKLVAQKQNLSEAEQVFTYIDALESEVQNGGFEQYFYNHSGEFAHETMSALAAIGAMNTAELLGEAIRIFPADPVPKDTEARRKILDGIDKSITDMWHLFDEEYYKYEDNIELLLLNFVSENRASFFS